MSKKEITITERIINLSNRLCTDLHEREDAMTVALLAVLAGQSVFLLGPPGTAKSLMARRLSCAFKDSKHFEYLMQKFSTPEEIFGPIDITELKKGNYVRKTSGYLPEANFAFLDEIWKSNPAILNTLLTIINEKKFRNGDKELDVPLKALIGASNETPEAGKGLEALWDRFVVRLYVPPLSSAKFNELLTGDPAEETIDAGQFTVSTDELPAWDKAIKAVVLSPEAKQAIHTVKFELKELFEKSQKPENEGKEKASDFTFYVSDRRWQRAVTLLKSSAFFSGRTVTNHLDTMLLRHCLWSNKTSKDVIEREVIKALGSSWLPDLNLADIDILLDETGKCGGSKESLEKLNKIYAALLQVDKVLMQKLADLEKESALIQEDVGIVRASLSRFRVEAEARRIQVENLLKEPSVSENATTPQTIKCPILDMEFVFVKGGTFQMGDLFGDGAVDERPVHEVTLDDFYIGKYPVTLLEWNKIIPSSEYGWRELAVRDERTNPVDTGHGGFVDDFILRLNARVGSDIYRLPTEAEWEYAARSGGKKERYSGSDNVDDVAWYASNSGHNIQPVGKKHPNGLGLYDMSGNIWEWCSDWYADDHYTLKPEVNPQGPVYGQFKVIRGGALRSNPEEVRSSARSMYNNHRGSEIGLRLVRSCK